MDGRGSYHHPQYDQTHYAELPVQQQHNYSYPQQYPAHRPGYSSPGVVYELPPQDNHIKSHAQELPKSGAYIHELPIGQHDISYNQPSGYHETKPKPHRSAHFYIPPILRLPSLTIVFLISLALIGGVEYGIRKFPHSSKGAVSTPKEIIQSLLQKRQTITQPALAPVVTRTSSLISSISTTTSTISTITSTTSQQQTLLPSTSAYVPTTLPPAATSTGAYVPTDVSGSATGYIPVDITVSTDIPTTVITSIASTVVSTDGAGRKTTRITLVPSTTIGKTTVATVINGQALGNSRPLFPLSIIFIANYLPIIFVVILRQFWTAIYSQAKLINPFTLLAAEGGASAVSVLDSFYLSSNFMPDPILALIRKHYFVFWTSLVYLAVGVLGPVSSELLFLDTNYENCPYRFDNDKVNPCWPPRIVVDPTIGRAVEALLTYIAVMTLSIMIMIFRSRTGIYSDPSSIASISSLVHHPEVVKDFNMFAAEASMKEVRQFLRDKNYKLGEYQNSDRTWRYGIIPETPSTAPMSLEQKPLSTPKPKHRRWRITNIIFDTLFLLCLMALLGIVAGYYKDAKDDAFNRFFNSQTFGPRFVMTGTGTLIAINWKRLERDAHTLSPYHRLAQSPSPPGNTILLRKSSIPLTSIIPMLTKGHLFVAYTALIAVFAELLIIFLGAIPYSAGQILLELQIAAYVSMALLGLMALSIIALMFWKRRLPDLPRPPDTLGAVVSYVADARMLDDFEGFEYLDDRDMGARLRASGKKYVYEKRHGSDGQERYLVDEDTQLGWH